jgi:hypothetical protein
MNFTKDGYIQFLNLIKDQLIDFHTEGKGIILRHDIDLDLERSCKMALLEYEMDVHSTYFVLNTAPYWNYNDGKFFNCLLQIQKDLKHEIGWHNNAITESLFSGLPIKEIINRPLEALRKYGINVTVTASHGDPMCYVNRYINYNVFGFKAKDFEGYKGEVFEMKKFGLEIEAYHNGHTHYVSDSHGRWPEKNDEILKDYFEKGGRLQILIHPEWWDL